LGKYTAVTIWHNYFLSDLQFTYYSLGLTTYWNQYFCNSTSCPLNRKKVMDISHKRKFNLVRA